MQLLFSTILALTFRCFKRGLEQPQHEAVAVGVAAGAAAAAAGAVFDEAVGWHYRSSSSGHRAGLAGVGRLRVTHK